MRLLAVELMLALTACGHYYEASDDAMWGVKPSIIQTFTPPANYRGWYESAEKCAGMTGNFDAITWVITPKPWGDTTYAQWEVVRDSAGYVKRVEIVVNNRMWLDSTLIIHESLHDILWRNGWVAPNEGKKKLTRTEKIRRSHPAPVYPACAPITYPWPARWNTQPAYRP